MLLVHDPAEGQRRAGAIHPWNDPAYTPTWQPYMHSVFATWHASMCRKIAQNASRRSAGKRDVRTLATPWRGV